LGEKLDKKHAKAELKEMIMESKGKEPAEKVIAVFCHRHGVYMDTCEEYYDELVAKGEIKKE
jgi:hypothetical protein